MSELIPDMSARCICPNCGGNFTMKYPHMFENDHIKCPSCLYEIPDSIRLHLRDGIREIRVAYDDLREQKETKQLAKQWIISISCSNENY